MNEGDRAERDVRLAHQPRAGRPTRGERAGDAGVAGRVDSVSGSVMVGKGATCINILFALAALRCLWKAMHDGEEIKDKDIEKLVKLLPSDSSASFPHAKVKLAKPSTKAWAMPRQA